MLLTISLEGEYTYLSRVKYGVLELMLRKDLRADACVELSIGSGERLFPMVFETIIWLTNTLVEIV